jgi:LmbE family N-acetylglucosaminyl deacetylase
MNVLVIAPHPDDEVIGCGGAVRLHAQRGERVSAVFLTSGELGLKHLSKERAWKIREAEARKAAKLLKITKLYFLREPDWVLGEHISATGRALVAILRRENPGIIYLPHPQDGHPDHQATLRILRIALKGCRSLTPALMGYEVWTPMSEHDVVVDVSSVMSLKLRALQAHRSQLKAFDYVRAVIGLNQYRGALAAKSKFAEVFQTLQIR